MTMTFPLNSGSSPQVVPIPGGARIELYEGPLDLPL